MRSAGAVANYTPLSIDPPAFHLRYTWTGWPTAGEMFPPQPPSELIDDVQTLWEGDGIRHLEHVWTPGMLQFTCSVKPTVSPVLFTSRIKGRLSYALRTAGANTAFSRKVAFRTIGQNTREHVEEYIRKQVHKEQFCDLRFRELLSRFSIQDANVQLADPQESNSGRYWYNLHLVIVTDQRMRMTDEQSLRKVSEMCAATSKKKGHRISARSVMPDHVHMAISGRIDESPEQIALSYMNNTDYALGSRFLWRPSYYVGTFGEYDMGAIR